MHSRLHIITRCTRLSNLESIKSSIVGQRKGDWQREVHWHIVFDTKNLIELDGALLYRVKYLENTVEHGNGLTEIKYHFKESQDDYLFPQTMSIIKELLDDESGSWIYFLDDDNRLHPDYPNLLNQTLSKTSTETLDVVVTSQYLPQGDVFNPPHHIRTSSRENMKVGKVDTAQMTFNIRIFNPTEIGETIGAEYVADGHLAERLVKNPQVDIRYVDETGSYYNYYGENRKASIPSILLIDPKNLTAGISLHTTPVYTGEELKLRYTQVDISTAAEVYLNGGFEFIVTVDDRPYEYDMFKEFADKAPVQLRSRWIHYNVQEQDLSELADRAYNAMMNTTLKGQDLDSISRPYISYITPVYNQGESINTLYEVLCAQTVRDWEWVIVDDSTDGGATWTHIKGIMKSDSRVSAYRLTDQSKGNIGKVKYFGFTMATGRYLAELDHDDAIVPECTAELIHATTIHPEAGFFYSDCIEVDENFQSLTYPEGFAFGYGKYYDVKIAGKVHKACDQHGINPKTIRHIVGVPNHIRMWERSIYFQLGGHNRELPIADDYELILRTFLTTLMCHIRKPLYMQSIYSNKGKQNTHDLSRAEIQRRVRSIATYYNTRIRDRFEALGKKDWAYDYSSENPLSAPSLEGEDEQKVNLEILGL